MREALAIYVVKELVKKGANIQAYDPKAMTEAQKFYLKDLKGIHYCKNKEACLQNADALILLTEWKAFRSPDFTFIKKQLKQPIIFDGRNQYHSFGLEEMGIEYWRVGNFINNFDLI